MNKNDFYKELMTQYALDPEKIRMNALKQAKKPVWQKVAGDYWKPALGAAAAVALTVAATSYANQSSAPSITVDPGAALSASQRLIEAEQNYYNSLNSEEFSDIYVTFTEELSYNEILMALSTVADSGEFELRSIYLTDDILTGTEIDEYALANFDEKSIVAVKISLPAFYYRDLQDLSIVYLAEFGSAEINDNTFTPMIVEDDDPLQNDHLSITTAVTEKPVVTTTPFSFDTETVTAEDVPVIGTSGDDNSVTTLPPEYTEESEETEESETPVDVEETEEGEVDEESVATSVSGTSDATVDSSEPTVTSVPESSVTTTTTTTYYRGDVGLLTQIYELNVANALEAHVAGNNVIVLAKNEAYLYTLSGFASSNQYGEVIAISNPKLAYKGDDCVILTGCRADGTRGMISVINLENDTVYTYDAGANIGEYEIGGIQHSKTDGKYFMKAVSAESTLVYELSVNGEITFRPLVEVEAPVSLAGYKNNVLYFTIVENGSITRLYSFNCIDGAMNEISVFNGKIKIKRGSDFESFAILSPADSTSYILDVNLGMLVPALFDETVTLVTDGYETFFRTNGIVYKIDSMSNVVAADRYVQFDAASDETFIINEINPEKVVVILDDGSVW